MFTQKCFIRKNSEKLRSELDKLGYANFRKPNDLQYLMTFGKIGDFECFYDSLNKKFTNSLNNTIDCGTNEELFLAIAALRYDSDIHQWFVLDCNLMQASENFKQKGSFIKCNRSSWNRDYDANGNVDVFSSRNIPAHKATVEELINHFNK